MISCKHASKLISKSADEPLTRFERLQLKLHLYVCEFCVQFQRNVEILRAALRGARQADPQHGEDPANPESSTALKERLKQSVREKIEKR